MELNRFSPYTFTSFAEIIDKHFSQCNSHLVRYKFSQFQYEHRQLPVTWPNFRLFFIRFLLDVYVIFGLLFAYLNLKGFYRTYNLVVGTAFGTKDPENISLCYLYVMTTVTSVVYVSMYYTLNYDMYNFRTIFEFKATMDRTTPPEVTRKFCQFFNVTSYLTGNNLKVIVLVLFLLTMQIIRTLITFYNQGVPIGILVRVLVFYIACQYSFVASQYMMYCLLCGLFFNLKIFKFKARNLLSKSRVMALKCAKGSKILSRFCSELMTTHRLIRWYDKQGATYAFLVDLLAKGANMWSLINFYMSPDLFAGIFCTLFGLIYFYSHFMGERVSCYRSFSIQMSRDLYSYAWRSTLMINRMRKYDYNLKIHHHSRKNLIERQNIKNAKSFKKLGTISWDLRLKSLLLVDRMIEFLSSPKNKFGFSYREGSLYTKEKVMENLLMFIAALLLIAKRQSRWKIEN